VPYIPPQGFMLCKLDQIGSLLNILFELLPMSPCSQHIHDSWETRTVFGLLEAWSDCDMSQQWETCKAPSKSFTLIKGRPNRWWRKFYKQEASKTCKKFMWRQWWWADKPRKEKVAHCEGKDTFPIVTGLMNVSCQYAQLHELHNMHGFLIGIW
jgi:hypothetical protein